MQTFDNVNRIVKDDLQSIIKKGDKLSIVAACFSMYAYEALKEQLDEIEGLRFIFTSPTFVRDKAPKEKREFYIDRLRRERALYGTEFEVKLRNELTQKAIARECADWIRNKVEFRSNITNRGIATFIDVKNEGGGHTYSPIEKFTSTDLGFERGDDILVQVTKTTHDEGKHLINSFEQIWNDRNLLEIVTEQVIESITAAYIENSPELIYYIAIYNIFSEFLADITEDVLPKDATGFKETAIWKTLFPFQQDAALAVINKLESFNGCILADSVGLGKTFTALAVIKYYELRNRTVLVLCPKKLNDNWRTFRENYLNNPIAGDRLRYDVLYHTDLSRDGGFSGSIDLSKFNWSNYDLIVIDESHNFRNGEGYSGLGDSKRENRYLTLLNKVIREGVKTKVLMLSATPVNTGFLDLRNQLALAYEGQPSLINEKLDIEKSIEVIFRQAQKAFNEWSELPAETRTTESLLRMLDFDFFTVLDSVTIARSRKHIEKYYDVEEIGRFPERMKPLSLRPKLTELEGAIDYDEIYDQLSVLNLSVYIPTDYLFESKRSKYVDPNVTIDRAGRERGIQRLMRINLLKRLESSVASFSITLGRVKEFIDDTIAIINEHERKGGGVIRIRGLKEEDFDDDDQNTEYFAKELFRGDIALDDMDYYTWRDRLMVDSENIELLQLMIQDITPEHDTKLQTLFELLADKIQNPLNKGNRKVLIFSAFADTAQYLYQHVAPAMLEQHKMHTAMVTGSVEGRTTLPLKRQDMNTVLTLFSPLSKDKHLLMPDNPHEIDILIGTDCISEGQNLQDCDYCINYDIHWNPVRIIQRFGRIDRIGSKNEKIQLVNFWPNVDLDKYLELKGRVESRMKATILTSTGDDNPIDPKEQGDLEYRKAQLERLQNEVVDIEEMQSGISIMDLGLNEFRLDLLDYIKTNPSPENVPLGLHALVRGNNGAPAGTIFILKNRNEKIEVKDRNQLHPFYMVYVRDDGEVHINHLNPKKLLDSFRRLCKGKREPDRELCRQFNRETEDGKKMMYYSGLLHNSVDSIMDLHNENTLDSFLAGKQVSLVSNAFEGIDDFELVCFLVVK